MRATSPSRLFAAGDVVAVSGVYRAIHYTHRGPHNVVAVKGEIFPVCRACNGRVRFELLQVAEHVTHDWDFAGPNLTLVKGNKKQA